MTKRCYLNDITPEEIRNLKPGQRVIVEHVNMGAEGLNMTPEEFDAVLKQARRAKGVSLRVLLKQERANLHKITDPEELRHRERSLVHEERMIAMFDQDKEFTAEARPID
jgi:hypothetical protein